MTAMALVFYEKFNTTQASANSRMPEHFCKFKLLSKNNIIDSERIVKTALSVFFCIKTKTAI